MRLSDLLINTDKLESLTSTLVLCLYWFILLGVIIMRSGQGWLARFMRTET